MEYVKEFKTIEEQADLMISRGLVCDKPVLEERLQWINYYRLSGYLYPFRQENSDNYIEGTSLDVIWNRYCFDRKLRLLILDGIARIEVGIKTAINVGIAVSSIPDWRFFLAGIFIWRCWSLTPKRILIEGLSFKYFSI